MEAEGSLFRTFLANLMSLQKQLEESYHRKNFLRNRLLMTVYMPLICFAHGDRVPCTKKQLIQCVSNSLKPT